MIDMVAVTTYILEEMQKETIPRHREVDERLAKAIFIEKWVVMNPLTLLLHFKI